MDWNIFWAYIWGFIISSTIYISADFIKEAINKGKYKRYFKDEVAFNAKILGKIIDKLQSDMAIIAAQGSAWAIYRSNLFPIGILNKCADNGYFFDFIGDLEDRSLILDFAFGIITRMNWIDTNILVYQQNPMTGPGVINQLEITRGELLRIKDGLDKITTKILKTG